MESTKRGGRDIVEIPVVDKTTANIMGICTPKIVFCPKNLNSAGSPAILLPWVMI